jgi:hypothetical protein
MPGRKRSIEPERKFKLHDYARLIMQRDVHYSREAIVNEMCRHTLGDIERAETGFDLLLQSKAIASRITGKYFLNV